MTVKLSWQGDKIKHDAQAAGNKGTVETAESILEESNSKVPVNTGALRNSGEISSDENSQSAAVSYSETYAANVHETPRDYQGGREHKYLESSVNNHLDQLAKNLEKELGQALR